MRNLPDCKRFAFPSRAISLSLASSSSIPSSLQRVFCFIKHSLESFNAIKWKVWKAKGQVSQGGNFLEWHYVSGCLGSSTLIPLLSSSRFFNWSDWFERSAIGKWFSDLTTQTKRKPKRIRGAAGASREEKNETEIKERDVIHDPWSHDLEHFNGHSGAWITFRLRGRGGGRKQWQGARHEGRGKRRRRRRRGSRDSRRNREGQHELETGRNQRTMKKWSGTTSRGNRYTKEEGARESKRLCRRDREGEGEKRRETKRSESKSCDVNAVCRCATRRKRNQAEEEEEAGEAEETQED